MSSNENDAMEWNDVLSEMNILICYMHESELRMQSYGARKKGTWIRDLGKETGSTLKKTDPDPADAL